MENRNPDNRNAGRNVMSSAIWLAANWFFASTEMKNPSDKHHDHEERRADQPA